MPRQHVSPIRSSPKEFFFTYRWRTYSWWQFALTPVVSSNDMTYENVVSVPAEEHNNI
jgi:hypothetical protein